MLMVTACVVVMWPKKYFGIALSMLLILGGWKIPSGEVEAIYTYPVIYHV